MRAKGEYGYTQKQKINFENNQDYRKVILSEESTIFNRYPITVTSRSAKTTVNDVYVSDKITVKPKQLQYIDRLVTRALEYVPMPKGIENPKIVIVDDSEMRTGAIASYNAIHHTIFITESFRNRKSMLNFQKGELAVADNELSTMLHEMIHVQDAARYRLKNGDITRNNFNEYSNLLDKESKVSVKFLLVKIKNK